MKFVHVILGLLLSAPVQAFEWSDLWLNDYQKAQQLLKNNPVKAAETFHDPEWQGVAKYNSGNYMEAAEKFSESAHEASGYNLGNALARSGDLEKSVDAYNNLLEKSDLPNQLREDAAFNREIVKKLMEQQEQESEKSSDESSESGDKQEPQDSDQEGQEGKDQNEAGQGESEQSEGESPDDAQNSPEPSSNEQQDKEQSAEKNEDKKGEEQQEKPAEPQTKMNQEQAMTEDEQATEQWLRQIPDDPSGLLRRKLLQSHRTKYPQVQSGGQAW